MEWNMRRPGAYLMSLRRAQDPEVITDLHLKDIHESWKGGLSRCSIPRRGIGDVETYGESVRGVSHIADTITKTDHLPRDGAVGSVTPAVWKETQHSGLNRRGGAGPPERWGGGDRDSRQGGQSG